MGAADRITEVEADDQLDRETRLLLRAIVCREKGEHEGLAEARCEFLQIAAKVGSELPELVIERASGKLRSALPNASHMDASLAIRTDMGRLFGRDLIFPHLIGVEPPGRA